MNDNIMNWKQAAIAWGGGKEIERRKRSNYLGCEWFNMGDLSEGVVFHKGYEYRLKPTVEPQVEKRRFFVDSEDQLIDKQVGGQFRSTETLCIFLNSLHNENEALKKIIHYMIATHDFDCDESRRDPEMEKMIQEIKNEGSNEKQAAPVEKADNIPWQSLYSLVARLEKVEKTLHENGIYL